LPAVRRLACASAFASGRILTGNPPLPDGRGAGGGESGRRSGTHARSGVGGRTRSGTHARSGVGGRTRSGTHARSGVGGRTRSGRSGVGG
jgi:hypothetical protein